MQPPSPQLDEYGFPVRDDRPKKRVWKARPMLLIGLVLAIVGFFTFLLPEGRMIMAQRQLKLAQEKIDHDDLPGALPHLERAVEWVPNRPKLRLFIAQLRLQGGDAQGALKEYDAYIELDPDSPDVYLQRGAVYQRLGRHAEAIADMNMAVKLSPDSDHGALNNRAYARAIANTELKEALDDIQRALRLAPKEASDFDQTQAMYLDTRGYVYHRLGREDEALADLNQAIADYRGAMATMAKQAMSKGYSASQVARIMLNRQQSLAVMLHHRGEVYQAQGETELAKKDLEQAQLMGYDPENGVY